MIKSKILACSLILLLFPLIGCVSKASAKDTQQDNAIADMRNVLSTKASTETVVALKQEVEALKAQKAVSDSYTKSQTFTKEEVQALITNAVNNLRSELKGVTSSSTSTSTSSTTSGGSVSLTLENDVDDIVFFENGDSQRWSFTVKNSSSSTKRFNVVITFTADSKCGLSSSTDLDVDYDSTTVSAKTSANFSADITTITYRLSKTLTISGNGEEDLDFRWYVHYQDSSDSGSDTDDEERDWSWSFKVEEVS